MTRPYYSFAFIKHYATKSTEEFIDKLLKGTVNSNNTLNETYYINMINNYYFYFNRVTKDKISLFERKLNIKLNMFNYFLKY